MSTSRSETQPESIDLLRRASAGDSSSLGEIYARFQPALLARIRTMMGPEARSVAESGDFLNGVFVEVMGDLDGRNQVSDEHLLRWMTAVARNNIRDSARRRREQAFASMSTLLGARANSKTPVSQAGHQERLHGLAQAFEQLDERLRMVLELRVFEQASFREIGERIGCSDVYSRHVFDKALVALGKGIVESP